ncbi:endonuclease/exonuclease/phosphatase family protein [Peribacillus sp. NJ11]|uniref:endonuclease/exonuclease/phosphatase family protein n=1 Tax=Peribacillus sp. NJ11 TaxID=3055861 RepID=UPI0025A21CB5|nr:endonuclease/exonuclease/phosphatase family protein [Peribacillus sp. NJ11]MDM5224405.1 endonuclease/exonuclease/phosphatase family protein [Peribacillus sp. NJ11]
MNSRSKLDVSFLTWNIYQGFDVLPLFNPSLTPAQLPQVVTQVFRQFLATNFPVRAKAIAKAIASEKPDLIGLQEAVRVNLIIPTFRTVTYDFIEILLEALEERGLKYEVAARNNNAEAELPDSNENLIQFLERDAILIRKDHKLDVIRKQEAKFKTNLTATIAGQPFTILRGWSSIDVKIDGQVFRMINTRLDPSVEAIRNAQALEIIQGPAKTSLPVVITGDLNAPPNSSTYNLFITAGFKDTWNKVGEGPGFTHEQKPDLLNAISTLIERFDYILFKNGWEPLEVEIVGESQNDRTNTGLWPSDHAGVSASLHLEDHHDHHHDESSDECSS